MLLRCAQCTVATQCVVESQRRVCAGQFVTIWTMNEIHRLQRTQGGSFIAPSGGAGGAAGVIEDAEGQLMWSEAFGKATRSVPCPQVLLLSQLVVFVIFLSFCFFLKKKMFFLSP